MFCLESSQLLCFVFFCIMEELEYNTCTHYAAHTLCTPLLALHFKCCIKATALGPITLTLGREEGAKVRQEIC